MADDNLIARIAAEPERGTHMAVKTRKASAPKATPPEEIISAPFDVTINNLSNLIARLRFLEADRRYHAAICEPAPRALL
jgi:hypothetical protein